MIALSINFYDTFLLAENGDADAQYNLGKMYRTGEYVKRNHEKSIFWYTKSAKQGNDSALFELALIYLYGENIAQDIPKALSLLQNSAEQGFPKAIEILKENNT